MSQENVEVAWRTYDAWNAGGPEAAKLYYAPDIEYRPPRDQPDAEVIRGREAFVHNMREVLAAVGPLEFTVERLVESDDGAVVGLVKAQIRGAESGVEMSVPVGHVWRIANGRIVQLEVFASWKEALEAVGLRE